MSLAKSGSNLLRIAGGGGVISVSQDAGGLVGHGYTPTHYISTSGASTMSQATYNAAANSGTPCTIHVARTYAVAGDIIEAAPGVYEDTIASGGGGGTSPIFPFVNSGSSGNPIILTAQYPAAYNEDSDYYTQFGRSDDVAPTASNCPIFGARNYIVLDGLFFDYANGAMPWTRGIIYLGYGVTGWEVRRCRFLRTDLGGDDDGDNYNCIHGHNSTDCKVLDCLFINGYDNGGSHNEACITTYGCENFTIEHNEFRDVTTGLYIKGGDGGSDGNYGAVRFNKFTGTKYGIECTTTASTGTNAALISQNLFIESSNTPTQALAFENSSSVECRYFQVRNNTFIGAGDEEAGVIATEAGVALNGCEFVNNIVAVFANSTQVLVNAQQALTNFVIWDYNRYYENGNTPQYFVGSTQTGIANWRTASSRDANSTEGDPGFTNQAAGDYTLSGGSACLTASSTGGPIGCYITGSEEIGLRASPTY